MRINLIIVRCSMNEFASFIHRWQTLIGALMGGIFALATAFVVAGSAIRRAQRTAAVLLIVDLLSVLRVSDNLKRLAQEQSVEETKYPLWVSKKLSWRRPKLTSAYDSLAANLVGVDYALSAHLSLLKIVYSNLEEHLARIETDIEDRRTKGSPRIPRALQATEADASSVASALRLAGAHATCAAHLLEELVLSRMPRSLKRIRMCCCPTEVELTSKKLLREGKI